MGADEVVTGQVEMKTEDVLPALRAMTSLFRLRHLFTGAVILLLVLSIAGNRSMGLQQLLPMVFLSVGFPAFLYLTPRILATRIVRAMTRQGDAQVFYRFDADGVTIRSAGATASLAYRVLVKTREIDNAFLLYTTPQLANIVPKRAFTPQDLDRLRALLPPAQQPQKIPLPSGVKIWLWLAMVLAFLVVWQLFSTPPPPR
jgi:hypothetical protein